jgi:hypothetical protein
MPEDGAPISSMGYIWGQPWKEFCQQRSNAKRRGIKFKLSFEEWCEIWTKSGLYKHRGRNGFVMHRMGDTGAYEVGNVEIVSSRENFRMAMNDYYFDRNY